MPLLTFHDAQGAVHRVQIAETEDVRLGTDAGWSNVILPGGMGVAPRHAILSRSGLNLNIRSVTSISISSPWAGSPAW